LALPMATMLVVRQRGERKKNRGSPRTEIVTRRWGKQEKGDCRTRWPNGGLVARGREVALRGQSPKAKRKKGGNVKRSAMAAGARGRTSWGEGEGEREKKSGRSVPHPAHVGKRITHHKEIPRAPGGGVTLRELSGIEVESGWARTTVN